MSSLDGLPSFLAPRLKLFLSVDLVGSTKLKHDEDVLSTKVAIEASLEAVGAKWFTYLIDFYSGYEEIFIEEWKRTFSKDGIAESHWSSSDTPSLWKVNGDELIYVLTISHPGQIVCALVSWKNALIRYRAHLHERNPALDVKATAWMAGFPIGNHEVAFWGDLSNAQPGAPEHAGKTGQYYRLSEWYKAQENGHKSEYVKDYIGPAVDTGFRIASFASPRRFPVSIEIAFFLSKFSFDLAVQNDIALHFYGRESMKGVLSGIPYPIFWIDTSSPDDELVKAEDDLTLPPQSVDSLKIRKYVELFFDDPKNRLFRPFIYECSDATFCEMPEPYVLILTKTAEVWANEMQKLQLQADSGQPDDGVTEVEAVEDEIDTLKVGKHSKSKK